MSGYTEMQEMFGVDKREAQSNEAEKVKGNGVAGSFSDFIDMKRNIVSQQMGLENNDRRRDAEGEVKDAKGKTSEKTKTDSEVTSFNVKDAPVEVLDSIVKDVKKKAPGGKGRER